MFQTTTSGSYIGGYFALNNTTNLSMSWGASNDDLAFTAVLTNAQVPVNPAVSDQKAGSVLVFPYYTSAADGNFNKADTLITITNVCDGPVGLGGVPNYHFLYLFFINGSNCSPADAFVCLTPNGSIQIKTSDYDPTVTGYLIAVAARPR